MATILSVDPSRLRTRQRWRVGGAVVVVRLQWLPRLRGWYASIEAADGRMLCEGRRVEPGASSVLPDLTLPGVPSGTIAILGEGGDYLPGALGSQTLIAHVDLEEGAS